MHPVPPDAEHRDRGQRGRAKHHVELALSFPASFGTPGQQVDFCH